MTINTITVFLVKSLLFNSKYSRNISTTLAQKMLTLAQLSCLDCQKTFLSCHFSGVPLGLHDQYSSVWSAKISPSSYANGPMFSVVLFGIIIQPAFRQKSPVISNNKYVYLAAIFDRSASLICILSSKRFCTQGRGGLGIIAEKKGVL